MIHALAIATPLGADAFHLQHVSGQEELGRLGQYQLELLSERGDVKASDLLGKNVTFVLEMQGGQEQRFYNGYVTRFSILGQVQTTAYRSNIGYLYQITLHPWLWFLTRTANCRIFQQKKVPDIIKEVFDLYGFSSYKLQLTGSYRVWDYCVQYRETDFAFVSRLMEQEGIYYSFEHDNGKHTLMLTDALGAHTPRPGYASFEFRPTAGNKVVEHDCINGWDATAEIQSGSYALDDFDFQKPRAQLGKSVSLPGQHDVSSMEIFDYPGEYDTPADGEHYARVRIEELHSQYEIAQGSGNVRGIEVGRTFKLTQHPTESQNQEYLVVSNHFKAVNNALSSAGGGGSDFTCSFNVIPKNVQFRSQRATPKPTVHGPQTAIVVGPKGEEIYTDKYGRVKVQFHWDRYNKGDENSSCWLRVSHPWAGKNWGMVALPRIGQEVIIDFLEGDPDGPIITGGVYNADMMPPYALPANQTQTGIKSHSSKGGSPDNFNEFRFEDKKGSEQVFLHSEKDLEFRSKHDRVEWVGNESHLIVTKDVLEQFDADYHLTLKGDHNQKLDGTLSFKIGKDMQIKSGMKTAIDSGQEIHLKAGMNVVIEAGVGITLKVGGNFINIGPAGVFIKGTMVMINSGGAAGSGSGASPIAPKPPREAAKSQGGETGEPPPAPQPPKPTTFSPQAVVFQEAAQSGAPVCAICNG